jgi:universal stress protein A
MNTGRPILYATDFSEASRPAFAVALDSAKRDRAPLLLLHVVAPPVTVPRDGFARESACREIARAATAKLDALVTQAKKAGVQATSLVQIGTPFDLIVRTARRRRAELVVIGTHGRTGLSRLLMGSVAERVVALAPCPVLTVRDQARRHPTRARARARGVR